MRRNLKHSPIDARKRDAVLEVLNENITFEEAPPEGVFPPELRGFNIGKKARLLGVYFENQMNFTKHFEDIFARARVRHEALSGLTRST